MDEELWTLFRAEVLEALDSLARTLEQSDERTAPAALRILHTLKGAASVAGAASIEAAAHAMEDELAPHADGGPLDPEVRARIAERAAAVYDLLAEVDPGSATRTYRLDAARLDHLLAFGAEFQAAAARMRARDDRLDECALGLDRAAVLAGGQERARLADLARELEDLARTTRRDLHRFEHLVRDWTSALKSARMLPLRTMEPEWRRVALETARELGREVHFVADVGDVEVDRYILETLRDPVLHLLRNAVDHGVADPHARTTAGKPAIGVVAIRARASGAKVEIEVGDDGEGIDTAALGERAVTRGLVLPERLASMSSDELAELAFAPGMSTATVVSSISGRGVGLDLVRHGTAAVGGSVSVARSPYGGAAFRLSVPATIVSRPGLVLRTASNTYVAPTAHVERTLRVPANLVHLADGDPMVSDERGDPLRVRWLASMMGERREPDRDHLVIVEMVDGRHRVGVVVANVDREIEFVSKSLPSYVPKIPAIEGAVAMDDGTVALVLDIPYLARQWSRPGTRAEGVRRASAMARRRILVVDDSVTSRTLERNILTAAGYEVTTAEDGQSAWELLQSDPFDLIVSDVQMPRLDGLSLTRRIRSHGTLKTTPVVLVTSMDSSADVEEGGAAGADEYVVKGAFDQTQLLEAVARLL
jgi:chemotaxis protein histidine kinase CheA